MKRVAAPRDDAGLFYDPEFLSPRDRSEFVRWLSTIRPLWELRFSQHRPLPEGQEQRPLLRPVYWLGNWQFACLDYYRPPHGTLHRCVKAEPFPPVIARMITRIEAESRALYRFPALPAKWHLNTCLINLYGRRKDGDKWTDTARVGEHKDFEPGPVASVSIGERALFQFVASRRPGERDGVVSQQWLDDGSLQIFGGDKWKKQLFHRVQRVDRREGHVFDLNVENFETRRINLTFRYVPDEHIVPFQNLSPEARKDVEGYVRTLSESSPFFARALKNSKPSDVDASGQGS